MLQYRFFELPALIRILPWENEVIWKNVSCLSCTHPPWNKLKILVYNKTKTNHLPLWLPLIEIVVNNLAVSPPDDFDVEHSFYKQVMDSGISTDVEVTTTTATADEPDNMTISVDSDNMTSSYASSSASGRFR